MAGVRTVLARAVAFGESVIAIAGGIALFLAANAAIRRTFGLTPLAPRLVAAALLATVPLGTRLSAVAQIGATAGLPALAFTDEEWRSGRPSGY